MKNNFWKGGTYAIVKAMKATGNQKGIITEWKNRIAQWAQQTDNSDAEAVKMWLPLWQSRPFYSPEELAPLWQALAIEIGYSDKFNSKKSARRLEHELDYAGLPSFIFRDKKYYVVEHLHYWRKQIENRNWKEIENVFL